MVVRGPTRQQKLFVDIYLKNRKKNATAAAIEAGYSSKSASSLAHQLLQNPTVLDYLNSQEKALAESLREEFIFDAIEARNVLYKIMNNPLSSDRDRIIAAKDFLDRAGYKPTDKVEHSGVDGMPLVLEIKL